MVMILVNRFSKRPFLIPYYKNIDAKEAGLNYISTTSTVFTDH